MTTMVGGCEWKCGCIVSAQAYIYLKPVCVCVCVCVFIWKLLGQKGLCVGENISVTHLSSCIPSKPLLCR